MLLCPWDFPGKNIGMGCPFLLQGIFPTQGSKLGLPQCRQILYQLSPPGNKINQLQQMVFITNILKSKREHKWLGAEQVHFCMWFPQRTNNIHCTFLTQLTVFCQLKYLRQMSSTDQRNTLTLRVEDTSINALKISAVNKQIKQKKIFFHIQVYNLLLIVHLLYNGHVY